MARPRKDPAQVRHNSFHVRFTDDELIRLKASSNAAGTTLADYIRKSALGRKPKPIPIRQLALNELLRELGMIASNLRQLEAALGEESYGDWARVIGRDLVEHFLNRSALVENMSEVTPRLNAVGHGINAVARKANAGGDIKPTDRDAALNPLLALVGEIQEGLGVSCRVGQG